MDTKTYWNNVKSHIKSQNTTQEWIAKRCGISYRTLQNWISRDISPDIITAVKIAATLNTTVEYLVTGETSNAAEIELAQLKQKLLDLTKSG